MQVWFQNRRAKFRRNERNILAQRNTMYSGHQLDPQRSPETPISARPGPLSVSGTDYLSWPSTLGGYGTLGQGHAAANGVTSPTYPCPPLPGSGASGTQSSPTPGGSCAYSRPACPSPNSAAMHGMAPVMPTYSGNHPQSSPFSYQFGLKTPDYLHQRPYMLSQPMT